MDNGYILKFIDQKDFEKYVKEVVKKYMENFISMDLDLLSKNVIDPIKLLFDKNILNEDYESIIQREINRQKDKTHNNVIGYFHQNLFRYIKDCTVPKEGWDIIFKGKEKTYYIELKNKHNTMNDSASKKTYMSMQQHLLTAKDKDKSICALVEVIAKRSQNIPWVITLNKKKQVPCDQLRRISIDKFYEIVTGDKNSFRDLCYQLPITLEKVISEIDRVECPKDTAYDELKEIDKDILIALYKISFNTYEGFNFTPLKKIKK